MSVLSTFLGEWNLELSDRERLELKPYVSHLVNSGTTAEIEAQRAAQACDWLTRTFTVALLNDAGVTDAASELEGLDEIISTEVLGDARATIEAARSAASAAWADARTAAWVGRGPFVAAAYAAATTAALDDALTALVAGTQGEARVQAMESMRAAVLGAGRLRARGSIPPAVLGHAYDTAGEASVDAAARGLAASGMHASAAAARYRFSTDVVRLICDTATDASLATALPAACRAAYDAAYDHEFDAPRGVVLDASLAAASSALQPAVEKLRLSMSGLLDQMSSMGDARPSGGLVMSRRPS